MNALVHFRERAGPGEWATQVTHRQAPVVRFDPQRRAASEGLKAAVKSLAEFLEGQELALGLRRNRRSATSRAGFKLAIEALACNFAGCLILGTDDPASTAWRLAVPRHNGAQWNTSRYRSPVYGQHFLDALAVMAHPEIGLIEDLARGYKFPGKQGQRSTIRPTIRLLDHLPAEELNWPAFRREDDPEVLILKGRKDRTSGEAEAIEYADTPATKRLRREVQRINARLRAAPLTLLPADYGALGTDDGQPIDPTRRTVTRIFNNGTWEQGGRLFGAFWETMRRTDRFRLLRISGEPIANVDYGQLFPRLAYLEAGHEPPSGDLYDIAGDGLHRDGWKQLLNALLLSAKPLRNWPEGATRAFPLGTKLRDAVAAISERHAPIAHLFGSGIGLRFMRTESDILLAVLARLFASGVTALPLHDSVLVAASKAPLADAAMRAVFTEATGSTSVSVKTEFC